VREDEDRLNKCRRFALLPEINREFKAASRLHFKIISYLFLVTAVGRGLSHVLKKLVRK